MELSSNSSHVSDAPATSDSVHVHAPVSVDDVHLDAPIDSEAIVASAENSVAAVQTIDSLDADEPDSWSLV